MKNSLCLLLVLFTLHVSGQKDAFFYGDPMPDAPELSARGPFKVGVKTSSFINKDQIDIINTKGEDIKRYDRDLKVEIWYPAELNGKEEFVTYDEVLGTANDPKRPLIPFTFNGRAARDAAVVSGTAKFPLIVVSHGYVGSRYLMTYLTENLASKGYIVAAIDHKESTFRDANAFTSTLLNRAQDIHFVIREMTQFPFFQNKMDTENIAVIGYSMGGFGALNVGGAGYSPGSAQFFSAMTGGSKAINVLVAGNEEHEKAFNPNIKAIVAFAPWGMERAVWNEDGLKGLRIPTFFIAGNKDDISGYEKGIKAIYEGAVNTERYLLTYDNARHNVAPNPAPKEALQPGLHFDEYYRYAEPAWDTRRMNNINQHFITAFLNQKLKGEDTSKYLDLKEDNNTWTGFKPRSCTGLQLLHSN